MHDLHIKAFLKWVGVPLTLVLVAGYFLTRAYHMEIHWIYSIHVTIAALVYGPMAYFLTPRTVSDPKS